MVPGHFYKHPNNTTICIEVLKKFQVPGTDRVKVKVRWWRYKAGRVDYCLDLEERFEKSEVYWKTWKRLS